MSYEDFNTWRHEPVNDTPLLSVVIPAYNEEERIVPTIAAIATHLAGKQIPFEMIVSDDGSTDDTVGVVRRLGLRNLRVLDPGVNRGKGAAVRSGVLAARGHYVLFSDADLSTPIQAIDEMLLIAQAGTSVVIGSRAAEGAVELDRSPLRALLSTVLRTLARLALGVQVADSQCGFKLFDGDVARDLFSRQQVDGFSFDLEILWLAGRAGHAIVEVPVVWYDAPGSKVDPLKTSAGFLRDLVGIRLRHLRARPPRPTGGLRVGLVTALPPSATTLNEYGFHLARHLAAAAEVEEVVAYTERDLESIGFDGAVTVEPTWAFNGPLNPIRILRAVRRTRPDVVMFNMHFTSFGSARIPAALGLCTPALLRLAGFHTVVVLHNLVDTVDLEAAGFGGNRWVNRLMTMIGRVLTRIILLADRVGTTMPAYVDILRTRYGADNVYLAPHGSFDVALDVDPDPSDGRRRVLAFGKFGTYKRLEGLLDGYRRLVRDAAFADVELVIAGSDSPNAAGYMAEIEALAYGLPGVRFTGYVAEEDVPGLFRSASVVAFPYTATTGSSGPLHQAGTYARAALVPEVGDFIELIEDEGFSGESFDPRDPDTIEAALRRVLGDKAVRDHHGARNHAAAVGLPLEDIVDWHILHIKELVAV